MADLLQALFPGWAARRAAARLQTERLNLLRLGIERAFEAAAVGRRNAGWRAGNQDANAELAPALARMRNRARDLRRNNPYAESGIAGIADYTVGAHGIVPRMVGPQTAARKASLIWQRWAGTTECDADGIHNLAGLQHLVLTTVAEAGECLVRRRWRKAKDGLTVPMQLQVLEPDYLDETKNGDLQGGGQIIQGVEYDKLGRRVAYWLYPSHPGATGYVMRSESKRISADEILHVFLQQRPGQARGYTWLAPVMQRMKNLDEMDDATIEQAKVAACFAAFVSSDPTGEILPQPVDDLISHVEPGIIQKLGPTESVTFGTPPTFTGYQAYSWQALHAVAVGLGVPYEILVGDLKGVNFTSGRMGWLRFYERVGIWQQRVMIPQFLQGVFSWFMTAQLLSPDGGIWQPIVAQWIVPRRVVLDPKNEGDAIKADIRNGLTSWSDAARQSGHPDPKALAEQIAADNLLFDELGLVLDIDPRKVGASGAGSAPADATTDSEDPSSTSDEPPADEPAADDQGENEDAPAEEADQ